MERYSRITNKNEREIVLLKAKPLSLIHISEPT